MQTFTVAVSLNSDAVVKDNIHDVLIGKTHYEFRSYVMMPADVLPVSKSGQLTAEYFLTFLQAILFYPKH